MNLKHNFQLYKNHIFWIALGIITIIVMLGVQHILHNYGSITDQTLRAFSAILIIAGISFICIFFIFSFVKFYEKGKIRLDNLIDEKFPSASNWILFTIISIGINIDIILLIETGATDNLFELFPQISGAKTILISLGANNLNDFFTTSFSNDLLFRFSFASISSIILVFLSNIRKMEIRKNSQKYPGTRLLLIFFFLSFFMIMLKIITSPIEPSPSGTIIDIMSSAIAITMLSSLAFYAIDRIIFTRLNSKI